MLKKTTWMICLIPVLFTESGLAEERRPTPVIFDTDICGDCDDVLALAMLHSLQSRGECRLLAVTVSADNRLAAPFVDAVNTYYGRGEIPIGVVGRGGVKEESAFLEAAEQKDGDALRYPRDVQPESSPDAVSIIRRALADSDDHSVVVIQVGFSTNLARVLESPPDQVSDLKGVELVRRKVRFLSLMAGSFAPIDGNERYLEYNVQRDVASAQFLASNWPTAMVWSGFEIGIAVPYPATSIERDYDYVEHHPVAESYVRRNPPPHNRPTWDLTSVLYAVLTDRNYFELSAPGRVEIEQDGFSRFRASADGSHRYLILRPENRARVVEALVLLSSQPPAREPERRP